MSYDGQVVRLTPCDEWMYMEYEKCHARNGGSGIFVYHMIMSHESRRLKIQDDELNKDDALTSVKHDYFMFG